MCNKSIANKQFQQPSITFVCIPCLHENLVQSNNDIPSYRYYPSDYPQLLNEGFVCPFCRCSYKIELDELHLFKLLSQNFASVSIKDGMIEIKNKDTKISFTYSIVSFVEQTFNNLDYELSLFKSEDLFERTKTFLLKVNANQWNLFLNE